jgi:hypothetical protein
MFHGLSDHGKYYFIIGLSLIWKHNPPTLLEDQHLIKPNIFCRNQWGIVAFKSFKECGGASHDIRTLVELDPPIGEFRWH